MFYRNINLISNKMIRRYHTSKLLNERKKQLITKRIHHTFFLWKNERTWNMWENIYVFYKSYKERWLFSTKATSLIPLKEFWLLVITRNQAKLSVQETQSVSKCRMLRWNNSQCKQLNAYNTTYIMQHTALGNGLKRSLNIEFRLVDKSCF